jgi:ABC-type transport system involved in multi-copper enzyme maturation, permease component
MAALRTIYHIARADLLDRIRQFSFLVILGLTVLLAYIFVPPLDAGYITLYLGHSIRGIYNSAWVGASVAMSTMMFLPLLGFYLVKNSISRDERTHVGQIVASTKVTKLVYLTGKTLSNFAVLSIMVAVIITVALLMQWIRGEVRNIELWPLISPFLFLVFPIIAVVAAAAVLFETRRVLQGGIGNVLYFALYLLFVMTADKLNIGISIPTTDMLQELGEQRPGFSGTYGIGFLQPEGPIELFIWHGIAWSSKLILTQMKPYLAALFIVPLAAVLFRGFQERGRKESSYSSSKLRRKQNRITIAETYGDAAYSDLSLSAQSPSSTHRLRASQLTKAATSYSLLPLVLAEWRLMVKGTRMIWFAVATGLSALCLLLPSDTSMTYMIWPAAWIWPLLLWSGMGSREARHHTQYLIQTSPRIVARQLMSVWLAGLGAALWVTLGMLIRLALEGDMIHLAYGAAAALLVPSMALVCGVLTGTNRTFEVLYMIVWYIGPFNRMPYLDFLGTEEAPTGTGSMIVIYVLTSVLMLTAAAMKRGVRAGAVR